MTKYFYSKTNDTSQASSAEKGLIIDGQNIKFYKNGSVSSFSFSGTVRADREIFKNIPKINNNTFARFFNENGGHSVDNNSYVNAFAYLRSNIINNVDSINRWPT